MGAILVVAASGLVGLAVSSNYRQRPAQLRALQAGLQLLEAQIVYLATPLPEALAWVERQLPHPVKLLYAQAAAALTGPQGLTAREAWQVGTLALGQYSALNLPELEVLAALGAGLGTSDREQQQKLLLLTREQLRSLEQQADQEQGRNEKVWRIMGFLVGAVIVLSIY